MCALKRIQILASNAKCTYLRSLGTLLYLSICGLQGVNMINVMLMKVHALKKLLSCQSVEPLRRVAEPLRSGASMTRCGTSASYIVRKNKQYIIQGMNITH